MVDDRRSDWRWCEEVLPAVSRTFALCIRFLPEDVRRSVLLSYLLCRVADTVEDAPTLPAVSKQQLLALFASSLEDAGTDLGPLAVAMDGRTDADAELTKRAVTVVGLLHDLDPEIRDAVIPWVGEMCRGMAEFATRTPQRLASGDVLRGLETEAELDRYCYYVAGTVGQLLTAVFAAQRPGLDRATVGDLAGLSESFGAGLQLVNILADVARDRDRGVSFIPETVCRTEELAAAELLEPAKQFQARAVLQHLAERAHERLRLARDYCLLLPRTEYHLRLFCLIPYFLALRTLRALKEDPSYPATGQRVKIGRRKVYRTVAAARVCAANDYLLRAYARRLSGAA